MTNFIFKSPKRLVKKLANTPEVDLILGQLKIVQSQNRFLRQDLVDVKLMLNKLLIDKHLQTQVDDYYGPVEWEKDITHSIQDKADLD